MKKLFHSTIYETWEELIQKGENKSIFFQKYNSKNHHKYSHILVIDIPRIFEFYKIIKNNLTKKKVNTILIIHESILGRNRFLLNIPFLFDLVCLNTEEVNYKFRFYETKIFSYPSLPNANQILKLKEKILNNKRKNKIVYMNSFKIALSKDSTYILRYKLVKSLLNFPDLFSLYGYDWGKEQIPFDLPLIAIIQRIKIIKKAFTFLTTLFYKPIKNIPSVTYKYNTLSKFDFSLAFEPTLGRPNTIFEKLFDSMLHGVIPFYLGPDELKDVPSNCYIPLKKSSNSQTILKDALSALDSLSEDDKANFRERIYKFLLSKKADRYRRSTYVNFVINLLSKK